jgi:predicted HAD superfamily Cof-like phosphohydrolase
MSWFEDVVAFHRKFGLPVRERPSWPDEATLHMRTSLISEELAELTKALNDRDINEMADALADLIYVCIGAAVTMGIDLREVWKEVQRSNMAKDGGPRRADGKILKPPGWVPPDIATALGRGNVAALELPSDAQPPHA